MLPKITPAGILATSSGFIAPAPSPIKPTNPLDLKAASQKANPAGLPMSGSNQKSLGSMIGLGIYGYDSGIYKAYLDQNSAIKNQGITEVNLVKSFAVTQAIGGKPYNAEIQKVGLDCKNIKYRLIESAKYLDGSPISPEIDHQNFAAAGLASWTSPASEKLEEKALKVGCRI